MDVLNLAVQAVGHLSKREFPPAGLLKALVSKCLGYLVLVGAGGLKVPQIIAIAKRGNADGLTPISTELEAFGYVVHTAYGFLKQLPVSAYGEVALITVQNVVLLLMMYSMNKTSIARPALLFGVIGAIMYLTVTNMITVDQMEHIYNANTFVFMAARLPQIYANYANGSTGALSIITCALNVAGGLARIFTSIQESAGMPLIRAYALGTVLNIVMVCQCIYYGGEKKKSE